MSCSCTQHSGSAGGESQTSNPLISSYWASVCSAILLAPKRFAWAKNSSNTYRSTSLCQTCLSRIHGLCRSDHPFPNFSPILHCNSTLLMSNSVIMKTRLFRSDFSFHKANFPFVYHCLYRSGQKVRRSNDKQSNLPDWSNNSLNFSPNNPLLQVIAN